MTRNVMIRSEAPADAAAVGRVNELAFGGPREADRWTA
jgi:predicted N-acetyltransferase YhbS